MILRTVIHTFHRSQKGWASLLGHIFARRLDKSSKTRRTATDPGSGVSLPPPAEPPPEAEEDEGEESPVWGFTATEALKIEILDNQPNDLARLFFLAALFDPTVRCYVDHA